MRGGGYVVKTRTKEGMARGRSVEFSEGEGALEYDGVVSGLSSHQTGLLSWDGILRTVRPSGFIIRHDFVDGIWIPLESWAMGNAQGPNLPNKMLRQSVNPGPSTTQTNSSLGGVPR